MKASAWTAVASSTVLSACASEGEGPSGPVFDPDSVPEDGALFDLGVQCGLTATGALLWTHVSDSAGLVARVWEADTGLLVLDTELPGGDGFVKLAVEALSPGRHYAYAFLRGGEGELISRSTVGAFRTPPEATSRAPLTLAATACTHPSRMPFEALAETARHDFDLFCHLGDISYNDDAFDRPTYDAAWATTLGDVGYRAVLPRAAFLPAFDDHEIADNALWEELSVEHYEAGLAALVDHLPLDGQPGDRLWASYRWGETAEIFLLDSRTERVPEEKVYLSETQLQWLLDGLSSSPCHFKVILTSAPITRFPAGWPGFGDRWEGYANQRDALLDHITDSGVQGVWFLTGDLHAGLVNRVEGSGPRAGLFEIMVGPGGPRTLNPLPTLVEQAPDQAEAYFPSDQFVFRSDLLSATLITFDPTEDTVRVQFLDPETGEARYDALLPQEAT